ncbi:hypothetical protein ACJMK2_008703 [Sinanodonta woodiana]|uniref:EF-hand domain-containing protein n=1 Tax=Sinanodonta woodiana TaxID=1069815 RepID=A0ABD3VQD5_SINWO
MEKTSGLLAVLFLCILFTQKGIAYGQPSRVGNDIFLKVSEIFRLIDRSNIDGYVSLDEFLSTVLDKDFNGDNAISREEWLTIDATIGSFDKETSNRIFQAFDTDNNDAVTLPDIIATFSTFDAAIKRDGKISPFEYMLVYSQLVTRAPTKKIS